MEQLTLFPEPKPMTIQKQDAEQIVQLIDVVTARGAFRGNELGLVASIRAKYEPLLTEANPPTPETPQVLNEETK